MILFLFFCLLLVADSGDNWSVGQKQLLCLGRIMLKRSKILFMDEATASVDSQTDAVVQRIIREDFADCTIISIAHRIPTVMDCDRVLVMDAGMFFTLFALSGMISDFQLKMHHGVGYYSFSFCISRWVRKPCFLVVVRIYFRKHFQETCGNFIFKSKASIRWRGSNIILSDCLVGGVQKLGMRWLGQLFWFGCRTPMHGLWNGLNFPVICFSSGFCVFLMFRWIVSVFQIRLRLFRAGRVKEFDAPSRLLERPSLFGALVQEYASRSEIWALPRNYSSFWEYSYMYRPCLRTTQDTWLAGIGAGTLRDCVPWIQNNFSSATIAIGATYLES